MNLISHRCNTLDQLRQTPTEYGVEIDLRSFGSKIILHHDPFTEGEDFDNWLEEYQHGTLILNVKEDGLEDRLLKKLEKKGIEDFFFLDQPFPTLMRMIRLKESRCALRFSEWETLDNAGKLNGKLDWLWIDCFTHLPLNDSICRQLEALNYKTCLVSPELQGRSPEKEIPEFQKILKNLSYRPHAVCTKRPDLWGCL